MMFERFFKNFDFLILSCVLAISAFSLLILWSIKPDFFGQQLTFFLVGFFLFFLFSQIDYRLFAHLRWPIYFSICLILSATLLFAPQTRGAARWIEIGPWHFQSSEILKPFLILAVAGLVGSFSSIGFKRLFFVSALLAFPALLIFKQPDLGNSIIFLIIFVSILFIGGLRIILMVGGLFLTLGVIPIFWQFLRDYQKARVISFLNPQADPLGTGYHLIQAMVTVGSGQIFGRGLGRGTQSHLRFLPEQHTDFIFASLAEELGFLGATLLLILFTLLLWRILVIAKKTKEPFGILILTGVFTMILAQVFINIGMSLGLLPITGITLPLMSYGGSSIISAMISLGIVESIAREKKRGETLEIR